jgi:hypothetical protein
MQDMREALSNSIRGARYHFRRTHGDISHAVALFEKDNNGLDDSRRETNQNTSDGNSLDNNDNDMNERYEGSRLHVNECS